MFKFKLKNKKNFLLGEQRGMTYIELIVVLSIFAILSSVIMFNYGSFQSNIDIKNLANDMALKLVQAEKYSEFGKLPPMTQQVLIPSIATWKPSYGLYFDMSHNKNFIYFTDVNQDGICDTTCDTFLTNGEFLEKTTINKGNYISKIEVMDNNNDACVPNIDKLTVLFKRPSSNALIKTSPIPSCVMSYIRITISSSSTTPITSKILVYPSGRIQVN